MDERYWFINKLKCFLCLTFVKIVIIYSLSVRIFRDEIPECEKCDGVVKPDIVFFGEALPNKFHRALSDFGECDLLIILGSSLAVQPFASLVDR